jgi:two-component system chemotaxis response regulator CheY
MPKILLVDDEQHIRLFIKTLLTSMKYEVVAEARNGEEAVNLYRKIRPDLVIMDINMPIKTGEEALQEIIAEFPKAKVIMLTSSAEVATVTECLSLGAVNFIRKDTPVNEIKTFIANIWRELSGSKE